MQAIWEPTEDLAMNPPVKRGGDNDDDSRRLDRLILDSEHSSENAKESFASIANQLIEIRKDLQETRHQLRDEMQCSESRLEVKITLQDQILRGKDGLIMQMALIEKGVSDMLEMRKSISADLRYWTRWIIGTLVTVVLGVGLSWYERSIHDAEVRNQLHGLNTAVSRNKTDIKSEVQRASDVIESTKAFEP